MKTLTKASLLSLSVAALSTAAFAEHQGDAEGIYIAPGAGYYSFGANRDDDLDNDYLKTISLGYRFDSPWAAELVYLETDTEENKGNVDVEYSQWRLDGLYNLARQGKFQPYLAIGVGEGDFDWEGSSSHDETIVNFGGGVKFFITDALIFVTSTA